MDAVSEIEELRGLTKQADLQITIQLEVIDRMGRMGMPTLVAAEALQMLRRTTRLSFSLWPESARKDPATLGHRSIPGFNERSDSGGAIRVIHSRDVISQCSKGAEHAAGHPS
jgi:hypothetical protein